MEGIKEPLDHARGLCWTTSILPNNFFFFTRTQAHQVKAGSVSANLHTSHELVVSFGGHGHVCIGDAVYPVAPGTAALIKPGEFHHYFDFEPDSFIWLLFKFDLTDHSRLLMSHDPVRRLPSESLQRLADIGARYTVCHHNESQIFAIASEMGAFLKDLVHCPPVAPAGSLNDDEFKSCAMLRAVACFLNGRMDQVLRIDDLAEHLQVSESYLRKSFRERFGISLGAYLRTSRFGRSVYLITRTSLSISEIAQMSGFESISSFGQAFRKAFGMTPSAYRQHGGEGGSTIELT